MNNTIFGKTMEKVCNYVNVKFLTKWDGRFGAETMIAKPNFHSRSMFSENLIAVGLRNLEVKFSKPIYIGMCIDFSTFLKRRYCPRVLAQHIDDCELVVVFVETRIRTYLDYVSLPQVVVISHYDTSSGKICSRWSMQFLDES
ncbi:hypothetical protein ACFW04_014101 [Cataglyphis niger]